MVDRITYWDDQYNFGELFIPDNGTLIRFDDINGNEPCIRSYPELIDVGIMGHCTSIGLCRKAGIDCYQQGLTKKARHMELSDFESIAKQSSGKTFQIALGGAGDPNKHPYFSQILETSRKYRIVPNLTTSGWDLRNEEITLIRKYCGAVAVSWYSRLLEGEESNKTSSSAALRFIEAGCTTNIHFVISSETINEAIFRLQNNLFPEGINAVIFILYKPVGNGKLSKVLKTDDPRIPFFIHTIENSCLPYKIGFDTCFTPAILRFSRKISINSIDSCEAGKFSMYIDSEMNAYPCSFALDSSKGYSLRNSSIEYIWNKYITTESKVQKMQKCSKCSIFPLCQGGCRIGLPIGLCLHLY